MLDAAAQATATAIRKSALIQQQPTRAPAGLAAAMSHGWGEGGREGGREVEGGLEECKLRNISIDA